MVVKQEKAEIHPPEADELSQFLPETDCGKCGFSSCIELAEVLIKGQSSLAQCSDLDPEFVSSLESILRLSKDSIPKNRDAFGAR